MEHFASHDKKFANVSGKQESIAIYTKMSIWITKIITIYWTSRIDEANLNKRQATANTLLNSFSTSYFVIFVKHFTLPTT